MTKHSRKCIGILAATLMIAGTMQASVKTWTAFPATNNWATAANWGGVAPAGGDQVMFQASSLTSLYNDLVDGLNLAGIVFNSGASAFTLTGNSITLDGNVTNSAANAQTVGCPLVLSGDRAIVNTGGNLSLNGGISGSYALAKLGSGVVYLGSSNSFSGGFTLSAGTVIPQNNNAFGTGTITLAGGTIQHITGVALANPIVAQGGSTSYISETTTGNGLYLSGNITGSGNISAFASANYGGVQLAGNNNGFTGTFTFNNSGSGRFKFNSATAGSSNAWWVLDNNTGDGNSFNFGTGTIFLGALSGYGQSRNNQGGTATVEVGGLNANSTFNGVFTGVGVIALRKVGNGTLTLTGAHSYSGATTVSNGTLEVNGSLPAGSAVSVAAGAKLAGSGTINGAVTLSSGNAAISLTNGAAATLTLAGGLMLAEGNVLNFDVGATADKIAQTGGAYTNTGMVTINIRPLASITVTNYDLITTTGANTITSTNGFVLGAGVMPGCRMALQVSVTGTLQLAVSQVLTQAWWKGDVDGNWNTASPSYNWDTDQSSGVDAGNVPGAACDVTFAAVNANNVNTTLAQDFHIKSLTFNASSNVTLGGAGTLVVDGGITNAAGAGTNTLGVATLNGGMLVSGGELDLAGMMVPSSGTPTVTVANGAGNAILGVKPGAAITQDNLQIGAGVGVGAVYQSGGSLALTKAASVADFCIGSAVSGKGYYQLSAGTLVANEVGVGGSASNTLGVMDVLGGTFTSTGYITLARGVGSMGLLNVYPGAGVVISGANTPIGLMWNNSGSSIGVLNLLGGTVTGVNGNNLDYNPFSSTSTSQIGVVNLDSGTLQITSVKSSGGAGTQLLNFNGGTLKASVANAAFITGLDGAYVYSGGATIDDNGVVVIATQALLAPSSNGVSFVTLTSGGSGYIGTPIVTITGGAGSGATALAQVDFTSGTVTNIVITNPGSGFGSGDTLVASLMGGGGSGATLGTPVLAANTSGGLTKQGVGVLSLGGANTYTGTTVIKAGTLRDERGGGASALGNSATLIIGDVSGNSNAIFSLTNVGKTIATPITVASGSSGIKSIITSGGGQTFTISGGITLNDNLSFSSDPANPGSDAITVSAAGIGGNGGVTIATLPGSVGANSFSGGINMVGTFTNKSAATATVTISGVIGTNVTGVVQDSATSTLILSAGANTCTGPTTVRTGTLAVNGSLAAGSVVTVQPGGVLAGTGTINGPVTLAVGNSSISLTNNVAGTLTLAGGLTLGGGNQLNFDVGATADMIAITGGSFSASGTNLINISAISGVAAGTYTLITGATGISLDNIKLGEVAGCSGSLSVSNNNTLVLTVGMVLNSVWWKGETDGGWNTSTPAYNWTTDAGGVTNAGGCPGSVVLADVHFSATGASNLTTMLGRNFAIKSLSFDAGGDVTIGGSNTLSVSGGLTNSAAAGSNTISAISLVLSANQTWVNQSINPMVVSSQVSGASVTLTDAGVGTLVLCGSNSALTSLQFTTNGTVELGGGNLAINAGGGTTMSCTAGATIKGSGGGSIILAQNDNQNGPDIGAANGRTLTINARITGTSSFENWYVANGTGVTVLTATNDYTGFTIINMGVLSVGNVGNQGALASNLGKGSTINISSASAGNNQNSTLRYTGAGETTDRIINFWLGGNNTGGIIEQSGTGLLKFISNMTVTGTGTKTLTLQGSTSGAGEFAGNIVNGSGTVSLTKAGTGTWTLSGANTYTGLTTVSNGTLVVNGSLASGSTVNVYSNATLSGKGALNGVVNVYSGTVIPGGLNSTGTFTFVAVSNTLSGVLVSNIRSNGMGGVLSVPNGTLNVASLALSVSDLGQLNASITTYPVATASNVTGRFLSHNLPPGWGVEYGSTNVTIGKRPIGFLLMVQ